MSDATASFLVACRVAMLSRSSVLWSPPGDRISRRSENMDRRIRLPLIE